MSVIRALLSVSVHLSHYLISMIIKKKEISKKDKPVYERNIRRFCD